MASEALYQELILEHNRKPRNFREMENADRKIEGRNPLCGDALTLWIKMDGDSIADVSFKGQGCAISKASASLMYGAIGTLPHIALTDASTALKTSGRSGDAGLGRAVSTGARWTEVSLIARTNARSTPPGSSPGSMRQFTNARAVCGSAFGAWPPSSIVATHVVRRSEL